MRSDYRPQRHATMNTLLSPVAGRLQTACSNPSDAACQTDTTAHGCWRLASSGSKRHAETRRRAAITEQSPLAERQHAEGASDRRARRAA
mmetsp:Transcript_657/g.1200  ORF Transcript_657/g.1200 Transcript_657/m.1200 type:complete len:90 (+) Transcript_657:245-514(+)